jgi:medium-chain acyl-[acyl-carrier-protein] hydrolase
MISMPSRSHLHRLNACSGAQARLYCFPFAGGSAFAYRPWAHITPPGVELVAYQLPGRAERLGEAAPTDIHSFIPGIAAAVANDIDDRPYGLFGHSMGATYAYEVALELRRLGVTPPRLLALSGRRAPQRRLERDQSYSDLPNSVFLEKIQGLGGTPVQLLENPDLLELILPTLRADFTADEAYQAPQVAQLDCPFLMFGGAGDLLTPVPDLRAWQELSAAQASMHVYPGGHFFLWNHASEMLRLIAAELLNSYVTQ